MQYGLVYVFSDSFAASEIASINQYILKAQSDQAGKIESIIQKYSPLQYNDLNCYRMPGIFEYYHRIHKKTLETNMAFDILYFRNFWIFIATALGISILLRLLPFNIVKSQSILQSQKEKLNLVEEVTAKRTSKLVNITKKLMEKNQQILSDSIYNIQTTLNKNQIVATEIKECLRIMTKQNRERGLTTK